MPMAADQKRKRLNGASMVSYCSPEQYRTKRKNSGIGQSDLTMKSHVSVEWDGKHQKVVAKREQIGISWRQMRPFANLAHNGHKVLADVLAIPQEIFDLDSLSEVLSYEVWNTQLSDNERNLLMQFLPSGLETHQVVEELLSGDNFHFGNPFVKWGASLCSGDLHPDMIVNQEQHLKSDKRAYYSQLRNYHKDMIGFLIKLKERWESCNDPEKEILPNIQSLKNGVEKRRLSKLNEFRVDDNRNATRTSDSYSWGAEEKSYRDNHISSMRQGDELQRSRVFGKNFSKGKPRRMMVSSDFMLSVRARPNKVGKLQKLDIHASDGDKYMSFIKISKKQHELVQNLKLSCKSIPASTLNHILGDLDNIHVQPFGLFIKEEQKKLHEHWLELVNKDLPVAYANWTERLIQKHTMRNSLVLEMKDKSNILVEDEDIVSTRVHAQDPEDGSVNNQSNMENYEDSIARFPENPSLNNSYHASTDKLHPLIIDLEENNLSNGDDTSQNITEHSRIMNSQDDPISKRAPFSSDDHTWQAVEMSQCYYDSAVTQNYTANSLSLINPRVNEDTQTQMIGPKSVLHLKDTSKELLHSQSGDGPFSSYQSQDRINLIQSLIKGKGVNPYHREQQRAEGFVCLKCGDIGFVEALVFCNKCEAYGLHRYCLDGPVIVKDDVTWFCEDCEPNPIVSCSRAQTTPLSSKRTDSVTLANNAIQSKRKLKNCKNRLKKSKLQQQKKTENKQKKISNSGFVAKRKVVLAVSRSLPKPEHPQCSISRGRENKSKSGSGQVPRDVPNSNGGLRPIQISQVTEKKQKKVSNSGLVAKTKVALADSRSSPEPEHSQCSTSRARENKSKSKSGPVPRDVPNSNGGLRPIQIFQVTASDDINRIALASDCYAQPIADPIWRGRVYVSDEAIGTVNGLLAHLSNLACTKVIEETLLLPEVLFADLPSRSEVWPPSFKKEAPTDKSIALYFFPENESSEKIFDKVVDDIIRMEVAIRVVTKNAVLLIFPSTLLPTQHKRFQAKYYLWGVFRRK